MIYANSYRIQLLVTLISLLCRRVIEAIDQFNVLLAVWFDSPLIKVKVQFKVRSLTGGI